MEARGRELIGYMKEYSLLINNHVYS